MIVFLTDLVPKSMSVEKLKSALRHRGLSTSGKKDLLVRRLEGALGSEIV